MEEDILPEVEQEEQIDTDSEDTESESEEKENYRAKLNVTNRFLQKEGYKFENGRWIKPETVEKPKAESRPQTNDDNLSSKDVLVLAKNPEINEDDIDYLVSQRKATGMDIASLLKDEDVRVVLEARSKRRKTADAQNTRPARAGSHKPDGATILRELLRDGKVPEPGSDEALELFRARQGGGK